MYFKILTLDHRLDRLRPWVEAGIVVILAAQLVWQCHPGTSGGEHDGRDRRRNVRGTHRTFSRMVAESAH